MEEIDNEETAVQDFLQILEEHRKNCESQGKYVEAEIAKNRIHELRKHEQQRRKESVKSRQIAERLGIEEAHMLEFQQFTSMWDAKMHDFERHQQELEQGMKERHSMELHEFRIKLREEAERPAKFSRELLNLRKIQETLAKQREYAEAHKIKKKADALEAWELEKQSLSNQKAQGNREGKLNHQQNQELLALRKRISSGRDELKKQRQVELERLLQRFQNVKMELEQQQSIERMKLAKYAGMAPAPAAVGKGSSGKKTGKKGKGSTIRR